MNIYFILNNLHFAFEILGALAFLIVAWLAFDAFKLRRDFLTASRGIGFSSLAVWQFIHAFYAGSDFLSYTGYFFYIFGLFLILVNLILEKPVERPAFKAIVILPSVAIASSYAEPAAALLYLAITYFAFSQYKAEQKKILKPFFVGFGFLFVGALISVFYETDFLSPLWIVGHVSESIGFLCLTWWVWQYLQLRIKEQLTIILVYGTLIISVLVTLAFSTILVGQVEAETKNNLLTNARVLDLAITSLKEEASAKVNLAAQDSVLGSALSKNDFAALEALLKEKLQKEKLGFLLVADKNGDVLLRAHSLAAKEDSVSGELAAGRALLGNDALEIEFSPAEKFSVRAASPIMQKGQVIGVVVGGFLLDNALADSIKRITGLEMSIYHKDAVVATSVLNPDGRTRSTGIKLVDKEVKEKVLEKGEEAVVRTEILGRETLASYIPIKNSGGKIVGAVSSLKPQKEILSLIQGVSRLTLIAVAVLMLIFALPIHFATRRIASGI